MRRTEFERLSRRLEEEEGNSPSFGLVDVAKKAMNHGADRDKPAPRLYDNGFWKGNLERKLADDQYIMKALTDSLVYQQYNMHLLKNKACVAANIEKLVSTCIAIANIA